MEVIKPSRGFSRIDELAERVFLEAVRSIGGLRKLTEYRNLTWLPSLAEAALVVVMREEAGKSAREIARELGITEMTVRNILEAKPERLIKALAGEVEKADTHKAGALAKMAYERVKQGKELPPTPPIERMGPEWPIRIAMELRGVDFPVEASYIIEKLGDPEIMGKRLSQLLEGVGEVRSPSELVKIISERLGH